MFNPVHKIKKFVKNPDGSSYWYEDTIHGWLSTGVKDKNGREIFEGDKVKYMDWDDNHTWESSGVVEFWKLEFIVRDKNGHELWIEALQALEVIGHIAEDEK